MTRRFIASCVLVFAGFAAGLVVTGPWRTASGSGAVTRLEAGSPSEVIQPQRESRAPAVPQVPAPSPVAAIPSVGATGTDFTRVASQAIKGVANISSLQVVRTSNSPFASDPFFSYFFGNGDDMFGSQDRRSLSLGSGVIVSPDGYVVTNNHVVGENVREITVVLPDKREVHGTVVGTDPATDIALLKLNLTGLAVVPWGDSSQLKVGEWVLAIGSPFQLSQTVTAGIVSATGRGNLGFADYEDFIQTDAAINPGNSGGALINTRGELVGINTGIFSQSGGYQGIGFAVPSNLARHVVTDLMKFGEVRRGSLGYLGIEKLTSQTAEEVGAKSTSGALVSRMTRGSPTYAAGIRPGDVIVAFNGQPVDDPSQLFRLIADAKIGSTATLAVIRNGRSLDIKLPVVADSRGRGR
jgi:serine protease Do